MRYCAQPGCSTLVDKGRCATHARRADQARGTAQQRGYTSRWATYAAAFRQQHPFCGERADGTRDTVHSRCAKDGLDTPAECVDHTIPLRQGGSMWDETNHMSACQACNLWKANTIEQQQRRTA
jgi:5-methylcytosine-specific restriction protein A